MNSTENRRDLDWAASGFCIGNIAVQNRVVLAPMSGVTDAPFRRLVSELGAGLVVGWKDLLTVELPVGAGDPDAGGEPDVPRLPVEGQLALRCRDPLPQGRRAEALDGRLDVLLPPGGGTTIRAELPCGS